jgi:hypothetical protein
MYEILYMVGSETFKTLLNIPDVNANTTIPMHSFTLFIRNVAWNQFITAILISVICIKMCRPWQSVIKNENIINNQITYYSQCNYSWIFTVDTYWLRWNSMHPLLTSKELATESGEAHLLIISDTRSSSLLCRR